MTSTFIWTIQDVVAAVMLVFVVIVVFLFLIVTRLQQVWQWLRSKWRKRNE